MMQLICQSQAVKWEQQRPKKSHRFKKVKVLRRIVNKLFNYSTAILPYFSVKSPSAEPKGILPQRRRVRRGFCLFCLPLRGRQTKNILHETEKWRSLYISALSAEIYNYTLCASSVNNPVKRPHAYPYSLFTSHPSYL